jgi:hypothetical protein
MEITIFNAKLDTDGNKHLFGHADQCSFSETNEKTVLDRRFTMTTIEVAKVGALLAVLAAHGRAPEIPEAADSYGWLIGSDFNFDFNVSFTEEQQREGRIEYNYERGSHAMDATT